MKKLVIEDILIFENSGNVDFESLEPIAVLSSWDEYQKWMDGKFEGNYIPLVNGKEEEITHEYEYPETYEMIKV